MLTEMLASVSFSCQLDAAETLHDGIPSPNGHMLDYPPLYIALYRPVELTAAFFAKHQSSSSPGSRRSRPLNGSIGVRSRAVPAFTCQMGVRISSTSALLTSETGRLPIRGKA